MEDVIHIFPINDTGDHEMNCGVDRGQFDDGCELEITYCKCRCKPVMYYEGHTLIVVHSSFDGREGVEWANEILNNK